MNLDVRESYMDVTDLTAILLHRIRFFLFYQRYVSFKNQRLII